MWVFLSPHFDDVIFSCGGLIYELVLQKQAVSIITIFAGQPPGGPLSAFAESLHARWETDENVVDKRLNEDLSASKYLGTPSIHFEYPDCIYRRNPKTGTWLINENRDLFNSQPETEWLLISRIASQLRAILPETMRIICPISLGNHIDHQIVRLAAETLPNSLCYYPDFPYSANRSASFEDKLNPDWKPLEIKISPAGLVAWKTAVAFYQSQLSSFWSSVGDMEKSIDNYHTQGGGAFIWCTHHPRLSGSNETGFFSS
jgi:LmbE family N-acetylglucosaminyl deacetylase